MSQPTSFVLIAIIFFSLSLALSLFTPRVYNMYLKDKYYISSISTAARQHYIVGLAFGRAWFWFVQLMMISELDADIECNNNM